MESSSNSRYDTSNYHSITKLRGLKSQSQYSYRFVGTLIEGAVKGGFASWQESALLHHSSRSGVADEVSADQGCDVGRLTYMPDHQPQRLGTDTLAPIWFAYPIAHGRFSFTGRK